MHIQSQVAVIAGGASGLGAATARRLAALGARVAVLDVQAEAAQIVGSEIGGRGYGCDVTSADSVAKTLGSIHEDLGVPRIAVNCAGIAPASRIVRRDGPHDLALFRTVIEVNLVGTFNVMRLAAAGMTKLPPLEDGERGVILNTASVAAFEGQVGQGAYAASKGGVAALTLPAARELAAFGIRVLTIAPGLFLTPLFETLPPEGQAQLASSTPFPKRLGRPAEFAELVAHICANSMLNGEVIRIDGALRMGVHADGRT